MRANGWQRPPARQFGAARLAKTPATARVAAGGAALNSAIIGRYSTRPPLFLPGWRGSPYFIGIMQNTLLLVDGSSY
ncbi:MAG: hypothetical protein RSF79_29725, partial [Janthinobacterium sp.]